MNDDRKYDLGLPPEQNAVAPFRAGGVIYNTTTQVVWQLHDVWLQWMLDVHIPEILGTGCFTKHQFVRVLDTDETDGPVYAVQYYAASRAEYDRFISLYKDAFAAEENNKWNSGAFSFSSLMQVVH